MKDPNRFDPEGEPFRLWPIVLFAVVGVPAAAFAICAMLHFATRGHSGIAMAILVAMCIPGIFVLGRYGDWW